MKAELFISFGGASRVVWRRYSRRLAALYEAFTGGDSTLNWPS